MVNVSWTGAAGLEFEYKSQKNLSQKILIDPYYTRSSLMKIFFGKVIPDKEKIQQIRKKQGAVQAIIAGHTHFDHVLDIPALAEDSDCLVIGSRSLATLMDISGLKNRTIVCDGNETIQIGNESSVEMLPSVHGLVAFGKVPYQGEISGAEILPMKASGYRVGTVFAPKIDIQGTTFLHLGSAGFIENELENHQCDVLFLCVPGWKKVDNYPEKVLDIVKPDVVVLFHYDAFFKHYNKKTPKLMFLGMSELVNKIKAVSPTIKIIVPDLFETIEL